MRNDVERSIAGMPIMSRPSHATEVIANDDATAAIPIIDGLTGTIAVAPTKVTNKRTRWFFAGFATVIAAALIFLLGDNLSGSVSERSYYGCIVQIAATGVPQKTLYIFLNAAKTTILYPLLAHYSTMLFTGSYSNNSAFDFGLLSYSHLYLLRRKFPSNPSNQH
jgi:hypothetical protein